MNDRFCNPVPFKDGERHTNPDPFILRWCGKYYCYATDEAGVKVSVSEDLVHWDYCGYAISEKEFHHYWAPSVIYRNGIFYMYYSNIPLEETDCHQQHLKLAISGNPQGPFLYQKTFFDQFSIDSHPMFWNGELYMFYSVNDWLGTEEKVSGTCILLDKMNSPEEFSGNPGAVVLPTLKQEIYAENRFLDGRDWYTIEGACPVVRDGKFWILYSANAYENTDYFVGTAVADNKKNLRKMKWKKVPGEYIWNPLLKKNDLVEGTGHNTVTKAPNLVDDWIVYHGRSALEELKPGVEQREMRIDPLYYSGNQIYCPGPTVQEQPVPGKAELTAGYTVLEKPEFFGESGLFYVMECWLSAEKNHTGARYGIYLDYQDDRNCIELQIHTGKRKIKAVSCKGGIRMEIKSRALPDGYDYTVPHLLRIRRNQTDYEVEVDEEVYFKFSSAMRTAPGRIGIRPYFTRVTMHSFALTCYAQLPGKQLRHLDSFYRTSGASVSKYGCHGPGNELLLEASDVFSESYVEEFSLRVKSEQNKICICYGEKEYFSTANRTGNFSVYHGAENGMEWFWTDRKRENTEAAPKKERKTIYLKGLEIMSYRYKKIELFAKSWSKNENADIVR